MSLEGSCNCGQITVKIPTPPAGSLGLCHCIPCRKSSGCVATFGLRVKKEDVVITGQPKEFTETGSSGGKLWRHFCSNCGSPIYDADTIEPENYFVKAGLFPPGNLPIPDRHIFTKNFESWERPYPGATTTETQ